MFPTLTYLCYSIAADCCSLATRKAEMFFDCCSLATRKAEMFFDCCSLATRKAEMFLVERVRNN